MLRLVVPIVLLLLMLFSGAAWLISHKHKPPQEASRQQAKKLAPGEVAKSTEPAAEKSAKAEVEKQADAGASFDVARIDPKGTSVFAGRAEPNSSVVITADGKELGVAKADENGEWTFTTEQAIANPDAKLGLYRAPPGYQPQVASSEARAASKVPPAALPEPEPKTARSVTSNMIKNLQGMVEAARTPGSEIAAAPPPKLPSDAPSTTAAAQPPPPLAQPSATEQPDARNSVPVPITFVFNEATLTGDGHKAAELLLEYLQLKRFSRISLTGHADERGTHELNMNLSKERLETVARLLRSGGFRGELVLVPKGKTEPYTGVVRGDFSQDDLYQLDRRVELVVRP